MTREEVERVLLELLKKICALVGLNLEDWDLDKELYRALVGKNLEKTLPFWEEYDKVYLSAETLGIHVNTDFYWFYKINEKNKQ